MNADSLIHCPKCGGPADNGHDRCLPPNPYWCVKCMKDNNLYPADYQSEISVGSANQKELVLSLSDIPPEGIRIMEPAVYPSILIVPGKPKPVMGEVCGFCNQTICHPRCIHTQQPVHISHEDGMVTIHLPHRNLMVNIADDNTVSYSDKSNGYYANSGKEATKRESGEVEKRLKTAIGGLRSIAYGDAQTWPNCSSREVAKQALADCGGEK